MWQNVKHDITKTNKTTLTYVQSSNFTLCDVRKHFSISWLSCVNTSLPLVLYQLKTFPKSFLSSQNCFVKLDSLVHNLWKNTSSRPKYKPQYCSQLKKRSHPFTISPYGMIRGIGLMFSQEGTKISCMPFTATVSTVITLEKFKCWPLFTSYIMISKKKFSADQFYSTEEAY